MCIGARGASKCVSEKNELLSWGDRKYQYISEDNYNFVLS